MTRLLRGKYTAPSEIISLAANVHSCAPRRASFQGGRDGSEIDSNESAGFSPARAERDWIFFLLLPFLFFFFQVKTLLIERAAHRDKGENEASIIYTLSLRHHRFQSHRHTTTTHTPTAGFVSYPVAPGFCLSQ